MKYQAMKQLFLFSLFIAQTPFIFSQYLCDQYAINFEDTSSCTKQLVIDTIANPNNIWQIGKPQKTIFDSAFSLPNVIVTDTVNSYPVNDTSLFIIKNQETNYGFVAPHTVILSGHYRVNSDSLNDYGMIEFSPDNGVTWIDLLNDTVYNSYYYWKLPKPVLTGNSSGWQDFYVNLARLGPLFNIQIGDTVQYRFTFISDSIADTFDGLTYDNLIFEDWVEGIDELGFDLINSIAFPNPVRKSLTIELSNPNSVLFNLTIYDNLGKQIFTLDNTTERKIQVDTDNFNSGFYHYKLISIKGKKRSWGKFIVENE